MLCNKSQSLYYRSPEKSSAEVCGIVISTEDAAKLGIEDILHIGSIRDERIDVGDIEQTNQFLVSPHFITLLRPSL